MRFFKHGDALAIVVPEALRKKTGVKEGDEYEFMELEPGFFILAEENALEERIRKSVSQKFSEKTFFKQSGKLSELNSIGYKIVESEEEAKRLGRELEQEIKQGLVKGVRGFDKKYYIVSREFYESNARKIIDCMQGDSTAEAIAGKTSLNELACTALLQVMKEEGEVIEKKLGTYALVK